MYLEYVSNAFSKENDIMVIFFQRVKCKFELNFHDSEFKFFFIKLPLISERRKYYFGVTVNLVLSF